ncbi:MAG: flavin reductase family protein [Candidatus Humimicrobiaceae bacterium]
MKKQIGIHERLYPNPVVLVTSSYQGEDNIITLAWAGTVCSNPPLISISIRPPRHSHALIKKSSEFVINIPDKSQASICQYCGTKSGKDVDKFKELNLSKAKPNHTNTPLIAECPINIECRVKDIISLGTHDLFIGEVLGISSNPDLVYEDGDIDYEKLNTLTYLMGKYYSIKPV